MMDRTKTKATIEAILFAAGYPMPYIKLAETLETEETEVREAVAELAEKYKTEESGIMLMQYENACQLCTKEIYIDAIRTALDIRRGGNLSRSSLEALAIVAYHQPVTKSYVDQIRGVDSSYAVNNLCDKKLIDICGQLDAPGKPFLYCTTDEFLRVFGIDSPEQLPPVEMFGTPELEGLKDIGLLSEESETEKEKTEDYEE